MKIRKSPSKVTIMEEKIIRKGYLSIQQALLSFEKFDGSFTQPVIRESLVRLDAVAAVLWDPETMETLLVRQFRYSTWHKGPGWTIECVAGLIEENETPRQAIKREILEETGYKATLLKPVMTFYPSPGESDIRVQLFSGQLKRKKAEKRFLYRKDEAEDIQLIWFSAGKVAEILRNPLHNTEEIDAKSIIALYWWLTQIVSDFSI